MEQVAAATGFNGSSVTFYWDDVTLAVTRCQAVDVVPGMVLPATATPDGGAAWAHTFTADEDAPVEGVSFQGVGEDGPYGVVFTFTRAT